MGNLVTNILKMSGGLEDLQPAVNAVIGTLASLDVDLAGPSDDWDRIDFTLNFGVNQPSIISQTADRSALEDMGLAVLALYKDGATNFLREKQNKDPFLGSMPPEYSDTAEEMVKMIGLEGLTGMDLVNGAEKHMPGCILAGKKSIQSFQETGHFNWREWRAANWGTRASAETASVRVPDTGEFEIKFDTVNSAPVAWLVAVAAAHPNVMMDGASYDEDMDYAIHFVGDEPGELLIEETDDEEGVRRAQETIHGPRDPEDDEFDAMPN
jgi:hypothetical protein